MSTSHAQAHWSPTAAQGGGLYEPLSRTGQLRPREAQLPVLGSPSGPSARPPVPWTTPPSLEVEGPRLLSGQSPAGTTPARRLHAYRRLIRGPSEAPLLWLPAASGTPLGSFPDLSPTPRPTHTHCVSLALGCDPVPRPSSHSPNSFWDQSHGSRTSLTQDVEIGRASCRERVSSPV